MENIQNAYTKNDNNPNLSFIDLYKKKLVRPIEKFSFVRKKLHNFIFFLVLFYLALFTVLYFLLSQVNDHLYVVLFSILFFFIIMIFLSGLAKDRPPGYKTGLLIVYFLFNFAALSISTYMHNQGAVKVGLVFSTFTISLGIITSVFAASGKATNYAHQYQILVLTPLIKHIIPNARYKRGSMIDKQTFIDSGILQLQFRNYDGYDLIEIDYENMNFQLSNLSMTSYSNTESYRSQHILLTSNLNSNFKGVTTITNNEYSGLGKVGDFLSDFSNMDSLSVETDNPEFEKYFTVYSTYPQESKKILTHAFINRLLSLPNKLGLVSHKYSSLFHFRVKVENQKLYVSFWFEGGNSRNIFLLPKMIGTIDQVKILEKNFNRLNIIMDIIDDLYQSDLEWANEQIV